MHARGAILGRRTAILGLAVGFAGCQAPPPPPPLAIEDVQEGFDHWQAGRYEDLLSPGSWLSLTGLFWLEEGSHTFGGGEGQDLVFPGEDLPDFMGTVTLSDGTVRFEAAPGVEIDYLGESLTEAIVPTNEGDTALAYGSLSWFPMERDGRFAIRLTDLEAPTRTEFDGIEAFPVTTAFRINGRWDPHDPPIVLEFPSVYGGVERMTSAGSIEMEIDGHTVRISVEGGPEQERFRMTFADETNGLETYGGGRYVWFDGPNEDGWVTVDFNQAYNPPCVFTEFSTCHLPPKEHHIPTRIEAGEKAYGKY